MSAFTPCSTCQVDRLASTLDGNGQCPFCLDEGVPAPVPEPKYAQVTVVPSKNAGKRPAPTADAPPIPRAARAELQLAVDEAYAIPYAAPAFDVKSAEADPAKELALRALCRRRLLPFVQRFRPKYLAGWVHEDICRRLERFVREIEAGNSPRLLLLLPPRSGKSEIGSRNFPPWVLGQHPDWEVIAVSHTQSLTLSFSRYVRDLVRDPAYKAIFPDLQLDPSSQSIENWNTLQGGGYMAAGVGTGISGRGAHCLPLTERICTRDGIKSIEELLNDSESVHYALSYANGKLEYRRINGFITREAESFYRVKLSDGSTFEATGEHPVCVDLGEGPPPSFRRVDDLRRGESLVTFGRNASNTPAQTPVEVPCLPKPVLQEPVEIARPTESLRNTDSYMQPCLHGGNAQRDNDGGQGLSHLWEKIHHREIGAWSTTKARGFISFLLKRVLWNSPFKNLRWGKTPQLQSSHSDVHALFEGVSQVGRERKNLQDTSAILQQGVLRELAGWSCYPDGYRSGWATVLPSRVQGDEEEVAGGRSNLCCVHVPGKGFTPQGQRHREQLAGEPCGSLQTVSQAPSHGATTSRIESIEKVVGKVIVGDIEVDEAHNFILASGNLLLNCLICDDLVKDAEASDSVTIRENTWEWYISTAYTRLAPGGGVLGILTHWHEDDWAGRLQEVMKSGDGDVFEIVKYPAINEDGDEYILPNDTIQQFPPESDPPPEGSRLTRLRGTAIHPARYTTAMMLKIKNNLVSSGLRRVWNALYQQNPVPDDGVYFTKEMMRWYTHPPRREDMFVYQTWDFAITEKTDSDWTVCCTLGQDDADNLYVLHILRFRSGDGNAIIDDVLDQFEMFKPDLIGFEDGQIWKSLASQFAKRCEERKLYPSFELLQPLTDKKVRAGPLRGRMQNGKLFVRQHQPWTEPFRQELMKFPSGKHDDQCFSAGTLIQMADGTARPIETLQAGDAVLTPIGAHRVLRAGCTSESAVVYNLDGLLVGTGGHPIWVEGKGWTRLDSLALSDRLHALLSQESARSSWQNQSASSSTARSTGGIQILIGSIFSGTSRGLAAFCTAMSGCISTVRSLLGTKSITLTAITSTTTFRTCVASQGRSIASSILRLDQFSGGLKSSRLTLRKFAGKLLSGTAALKEWLGTPSTASSLGLVGKRSVLFANNALGRSSRSFQQVDSAQSLVGTSIGTKSIQITKLPRELDAKQPVFNIEVEDAHCYYANGILVHNCDAAAWAVRLTLTKSAPRKKVPPAQKSWKDKLKHLLDGGGGGHMSA